MSTTETLSGAAVSLFRLHIELQRCQTHTFRKRRPCALRVRNDRRPRICAERTGHGWMDPKAGVWNPSTKTTAGCVLIL